MAAPLNEISNILSDILGNKDLEIIPCMRFDELAGWDPIDIVTVVVEVECRFGLQFELPEIDRLSTIADLIKMIDSKQALAAA